MTSVTQTDPTEGAQTRTFTYDSAGRLTSAVNPEMGTVAVSYQYDGNGNVTQRSDSRVTVTSTYDLGNRVTKKTYSGTTPATPTVTYCYDALPTSPGVCATSATVGFVGRETEVYSSVSRTDYLTFDDFGRVLSSQQATGSVSPGTFSYTYTPQGAVATVQYPSGRTITNSFDSVAGRITLVSGASVNYAASIGYWANGAVQQMTLGNSLVEQTCLNTRMEPLAIRLGTATSANCANSSDALNLAYTYASSDNGNVLSQAINRHGVYNTQSYSFSATQSYNSVTAYDGVNRLKSFSEPPTSGVVTENYGYDAFGNRWVTSPAPPTPEIPTTQSAYSKTNRITGWGYDGSGNVTSITGMQRTFTYDAENRQVTATINGGAANTYAYDGDGRRVQKVSSAGTTTYIYDAQGQLAAEYGTGANPVSGTQYLTADHLGSTRLITDGSANTAECLDYYPFGREIPTGANGRPSCYSSGMYPASPDIASEKFTGKERDAESGVDFFGARYMSAAQGRWASPDLVNLTDERLLSPNSTANKYVYGGNNPLKYKDPDGRDITLFYEAGVPTGHAMLAAVNQQTNDFAFLSVGPATHLDSGIPLHPFSGVPGTSEFNLPQTADELRQGYSALTIQTTPEVAQQAIDAIRNGAGTGNYAIAGNQCSSACAQVLQDVGLMGPSNTFVPWTPHTLWNTLLRKYGKNLSRGDRYTLDYRPGTLMKANHGTDYGNARYGTNTFDFIMLLLKAPLKGCVTTPGLNGGKPETVCQ